MQFVLHLWPDLEDPTPEELLAYAVTSIKADGLVWDIYDDNGEVLAENVVLPAKQYAYTPATPAHPNCMIEGGGQRDR